MRDQTFQIGEYQVFYSAARIGYVVAKKVTEATVKIVNVFWRGDDRGFTAAKAEAERLHDDDMVDQMERQQAQQAGNV